MDCCCHFVQHSTLTPLFAPISCICHMIQYRFSLWPFAFPDSLVRVRRVLLLLSGACFLIGSNNALICWWRRLCGMETPQAIVSPKRLGSGWGGSCLGRRLSRSGRHGQSRCARKRRLAPLLCLPRDLAALEERVEGGGPEAGLVPQRVEVIRGGGLPVEAESGTDQTVVAAPVVAAVAVETRTVSGRRAGLARRAAGDAGRACSASGHPGQDHVNKRPQEQAHRHGHTESYDQRDSIKRLKYFQEDIGVVPRHGSVLSCWRRRRQTDS